MTRQRFVASLSALLFAALSLFLMPAHAAVDANRGSQAELETVKGIGPGLSGKILAAREKGAFKDWTDLQERVAGIGSRNAVKFSGAGLTVAGNTFVGNTIAGTGDAPAAGRTTRQARTVKADKPSKAEKATRAAARE
jgi:competence protein ComEA